MIHVPIIKLAYRRGILFVNSSLSTEKRGLVNRVNCSDEVLQSIDWQSHDAFKAPYFDTEEIWDLSNVKNIEIHFEFDNIPSLYLTCKPGELLAFGKSRTDVVMNPKLTRKILELIQAAR